MGAMNFFRSLASAFVVAVMGAILLAELGVAPQRGGGSSSAFIATASNASLDDLARAFSHIFAVAVIFLIIGIVALIDHGRTAVAHHRSGRARHARNTAAGAGGVAPSSAAA